MNNKKRRRKNILDENSINIQNNGISSSSLINLVEQYNSDSDDDEPETDVRQGLNAKVNDFFKEIQYITEQNKESNIPNVNNQNAVKSSEPSSACDKISSLWQECYDESTGYPYYWHIETNEVTWDIPKELKELKESCKYQDKIEANPKIKTSDVPKSNKPADPQKKNNPSNETVKTNLSWSKQKCDPGNSKKKLSVKKTKPKDKSDDSDDDTIEMITSFGDDNSESDRSDDDDERNDDESQASNSSKKTNNYESKNQDVQNNHDRGVDDGKNEYQIKPEKPSSSRISNYSSTNSKSQDESTEYKNEMKPWFISGYTDNSDNDDSLNSKKIPANTLFPSSFYKSRSDDLKAGKNSDQSELPSDLVEFSSNEESMQMFSKNNELPKINRTLENISTSMKGFQRKRRIAFDVLANSRGNDERLGLGFLKRPLIDNDKIDNSTKDISSTVSFEEKKRSLGKYSIDFIKGETIEVKNEISKTENYIFTHQVQILIEKLKILCEKNGEIPTAQVLNIQLQALSNAWESGDLTDSYFFNWLNDTKKVVSQLEEAAAPPEWDYLWNKDSKKYYYKNKISGEIQWSYPDIIGGAEEMEICTTPPAASSPVHQQEIKIIESNVFERLQSNLEQSQSAKLLKEKNNTNVINQNPSQESDSSDDKHDKIQALIDNTSQSCELTAPLPPQISVPSPPPPPRIYADDLKKKNKSNNKNQSKVSPNNNSNDKTTNGIDESEKKNIMNIPESTSTTCEVLLPSSNTHLTVANTPSHIEPLPPGVDQTESPYAIAAASIESPVIFSTAPQSNASIYAAAIPNPTNISIIGHHPALVHNQIVHYPAVYQHLHDQAIIAAANRFTNPEAVQLMLHHPGIYANTQVISKPPINMKKESLGSAVDSFYNDIASLEKSQATTSDKQEVKNIQTPTLQSTLHQESLFMPIKTDCQPFSSSPTTDNSIKEKKKKKVKIVINKKHKEVSSMVAKWKKAQNFQDIN
ncbi:formin-binding protein 4-like isoform X2 [Chelonus insularis]|uniref:formin-binding protein 4-like isoform X2 n=1 Tax=Chelonus insularis TaxID=460826 RepID=UPI001589CD3F|nr:formin-binding protein 4-like isoform X2 [Chelonus insularis]